MRFTGIVRGKTTYRECEELPMATLKYVHTKPLARRHEDLGDSP